MLSDTKSSSNKRKKRGWVDDMLDAENIPGDLIHQWSPNHKQLCLNPREENEMVPFVLSRRSRRRKESSTGRLSCTVIKSRCESFSSVVII